MEKKLITQVIITSAALALIGLVDVSCTTSTPAPTSAPTSPPATAAPELKGDVVRGGLLYDTWWVAMVAEEEGHAMEGEPTTDQPLWKTQTTNTRSGAETWRCKECHGWDYKGKDGAYGSGSHETGFAGIFGSRSKPASEILAAMKGSTNPDHDFSKVMDEQALIDLALFVTQGQIDAAEQINADKTSKGDAAQGKTKFEEVCLFCHGPQGNAINFASIEEPEFLGLVAGDNPWEFFHKVRFGQPGWPMPSGITNEWTDDDVANVLAYTQTLTTEPAISGGGVLYDKWWAVVGAEAPTTDQPLWKTQTTNTRTGPDTWRCKECHGWDYKGVDGAYGGGSHKTGFAGIVAARGKPASELLAVLKGSTNPDHDFSSVMEAQDLIDLALFMSQDLVDATNFVNPDNTSQGDPAQGKG